MRSGGQVRFGNNRVQEIVSGKIASDGTQIAATIWQPLNKVSSDFLRTEITPIFWTDRDANIVAKRPTQEPGATHGSEVEDTCGGVQTRVAVEAIKGVRTLSELSATHGVHPTVIAHWKRQ